MNYYIKEIRTSEDNKKVEKHAGGKAREDISAIFSNEGFSELKIEVDGERGQKTVLGKLMKHKEIYKKWLGVCKNLETNDTLIVQYPVIDHSLYMGKLGDYLKNNKIKLVLIIHDLALLRTGTNVAKRIKHRMNLEEMALLKCADIIVVHNRQMKKVLERQGISTEKMIELEIFDYYISQWDEKKASLRALEKDAPIIIAGNLSQKKSGYIYNLPDSQSFNLYGINYDDQTKANINYMGSFMPDDLPYELNGSFGLVWDGPEADTCCGIYGEYLRYNNPHKTSLYLASEIPVIVWRESAMADYVEKNNVGLLIDSINEIPERINHLSDEEYLIMRNNTRDIAKKIRSGHYIKNAIYSVL